MSRGNENGTADKRFLKLPRLQYSASLSDMVLQTTDDYYNGCTWDLAVVMSACISRILSWSQFLRSFQIAPRFNNEVSFFRQWCTSWTLINASWMPLSSLIVSSRSMRFLTPHKACRKFPSPNYAEQNLSLNVMDLERHSSSPWTLTRTPREDWKISQPTDWQCLPLIISVICMNRAQGLCKSLHSWTDILTDSSV